MIFQKFVEAVAAYVELIKGLEVGGQHPEAIRKGIVIRDELLRLYPLTQEELGVAQIRSAFSEARRRARDIDEFFETPMAWLDDLTPMAAIRAGHIALVMMGVREIVRLRREELHLR